MLLVLFIVIFIIILFVLGSAAWAGFSAASWIPMPETDIKRVLDLADIQPDEVVYDLGCGDGRILEKAAEDYQAIVVGIEISFLPYLFSKIRILFSGLSKRATIIYGDFYKKDLSKADAVVCFLTPKAMKKLGHKFKKELKPKTKIVSYVFPIPDWQPVRVDRPSEEHLPIYLYEC